MIDAAGLCPATWTVSSYIDHGLQAKLFQAITCTHMLLLKGVSAVFWLFSLKKKRVVLLVTMGPKVIKKPALEKVKKPGKAKSSGKDNPGEDSPGKHKPGKAKPGKGNPGKAKPGKEKREKGTSQPSAGPTWKSWRRRRRRNSP